MEQKFIKITDNNGGLHYINVSSICEVCYFKSQTEKQVYTKIKHQSDSVLTATAIEDVMSLIKDC